MTNPDNPLQNHLLEALPVHNYNYLSSLLEIVQMSSGEVLYESGETLRYAYFPTTCTVSIDSITEEGTSAEVAMIGNEGMVGIALFMGGETMPNRAVVLTPGYAYRLRAELFKREFNRIGGHRSGALQHVLLRYTLVLITHMTQTAVCNQYHSVDQQLCRWLLQILDRITDNEIMITHELIANMLGVRREGITEAAIKLQRAGSICYSRVRITVLDRSRLEARTCECYQVVKTEFDQLFCTYPIVINHTGDELAWQSRRKSGAPLPALS